MAYLQSPPPSAGAGMGAESFYSPAASSQHFAQHNGGPAPASRSASPLASPRTPRPVSSLMQQMNLDDSRQQRSSSGSTGTAVAAGAGAAGAGYVARAGTPGTPRTDAGSLYDDKQHGTYASGTGGYSNGQYYDAAYRSAPAQHGDYGFIGNNAGAGGGAAAKRSGSGQSFFKRRPVWITALVLLVVAAVAVGVGVGVSKGLSNKTASTGANGLSNSNGNGGTSSGASGTSGTGSSNGGGSSNPAPAQPVLDSSGVDRSTIKPLEFWNYADPQAKVVGVSLGNWLVLERWMNEDWFVGQVGNGVQDEYNFVKTLGQTKAASVLEDHWKTWVNETDLDTLLTVGVNHIRIPLGFWTLIPVVSGEPYINTTQLEHLEQMLGWMYKRGLRALIDMHAMPGSQNGDQSSGRQTSNPQWFTDANQQRSLTVLDNLIAWINNSPYKSVVSAVAPVNEPVGPVYKPNAPSSVYDTLTTFHQQAYAKLHAAKIPMFFHHGFVDNPASYWSDFATGKDPSYLVINNNAYPGYFTAKTDQDQITQSTCSIVQSYVGFPVPLVTTEWSLASGIYDNSWDTQYYNTQASAYSWSAGQFFWNIRMEHSSQSGAPQSANRAAAPNNVMDQYNFLGLIDSGVVPKNTTGQTSIAYIRSLSNPGCGPLQLQTYSNPSKPGN